MRAGAWGGSREAVGAVLFGTAVERPQRVLQPFGQRDEAFAAEHDMGVFERCREPDRPSDRIALTARWPRSCCLSHGAIFNQTVRKLLSKVGVSVRAAAVPCRRLGWSLPDRSPERL